LILSQDQTLIWNLFVCRRVVGRLPSSRSKARDGLSCEIARIRTRDFHLTTGTFNLVVKDRIAFRLSGALSVQAISDHERERSRLQRNRLSSKLVQVTSPAANCQPTALTGFPLFMHMRGAQP